MRFLSKVTMLTLALLTVPPKPQAQTRPAESLRQLDQVLQDVAERVLPAVVQISVSGFDHRMNNAVVKA